MHPEVLKYLKNQRVCVLAVEMPDGSPHAATVHFAYTNEPPTFVIMTNPAYRKHEALAKGVARASLVVGSTEADMRTLQVDGTVCLSDSDELQNVYLEKFPKTTHIFKKDVLFTFTPTWWRFTDWTRPEGKTIYNSDGEVIVATKS